MSFLAADVTTTIEIIPETLEAPGRHPEATKLMFAGVSINPLYYLNAYWAAKVNLNFVAIGYPSVTLASFTK